MVRAWQAEKSEETDRPVKHVADLFMETDSFIRRWPKIARRHQARLGKLDGGSK